MKKSLRTIKESSLFLCLLLIITSLCFSCRSEDPINNNDDDGTKGTTIINSPPQNDTPAPCNYKRVEKRIASTTPIGIETGGETGTYIKIGRDIKEVCEGVLNIKVNPSNGSLDNIVKLLESKKSQYGIVQNDALDYFKRKRYKSGNLEKELKYIFPLYNEEIHIVVNKNSNINSIDDLEGKRVNVGKANSGSWVTATMIKELTNINWIDSNFDPRKALIDVINQELDAMIYVVGKPAAIFSEKSLSHVNSIKLLPCFHKKLEDFYLNAKINADTYEWQDETVDVYAVKAILITYDYACNPEVPRYGEAAWGICKLINQINSNLDCLRKEGHEKWKEIDPQNLRDVNWEVHKQAAYALKYANCPHPCGISVASASGFDEDENSQLSCVACDMKNNNAANYLKNGNYCRAQELYQKILDVCMHCGFSRKDIQSQLQRAKNGCSS